MLFRSNFVLLLFCAQILQKKLMSLEDAISIGHDVQGSDVNLRVQLWTLYEELRKIVLLV